MLKKQNSTRQGKSDDGQTNNFTDFLDQIKEGQNNIDMKLFKSYLTSKTPDEMVWALYNSKSKIENNGILSPIINKFDYFAKRTDEMPKDDYKRTSQKIADEILKLNEQIQWGKGLKIVTPDQMLSRLPFFSLIKSKG